MKRANDTQTTVAQFLYDFDYELEHVRPYVGENTAEYDLDLQTYTVVMKYGLD